MNKLSKYTKEELIKIASCSNSIKELARKIGYVSGVSGATYKVIRNHFEHLGIDLQSILSTNSKGIVYKKYASKEVFCLNSKASQSILRKRYSLINAPSKCSICGLLDEWNDKHLTLILDHKNGNPHDNRLDNLRWVCPNCNQQLDTTGARNIKTKPTSYKKYKGHECFYCPDCGKLVSRKGVKCISCSHKPFYKCAHPDKNTLQKDLSNMSLVDIGHKYGVTDNSIRKWCKKYGLSYKKYNTQ